MDQITAALEQLLDAIRLCQEGRFASALTLAGAAEEILPRKAGSLLDTLTTAPFPAEISKEFAEASVTERVRHFNGSRNWLKHHKPDELVRNIDQDDAELMIARAIDRLYLTGFDINSVSEIVDFRDRYIKSVFDI